MKPIIPIEKLATNVIAELERLRYSYDSICGFRTFYKRVIDFANEKKELYFSEELGREFLKEKYNCTINYYKEAMPRPYRHAIRKIRILGDYQLHGVIVRRIVKKTGYVKPPQFEKELTAYESLLWTEKRPNETDSKRSTRISIVRGFAKYLVRLGYEAYIFPAAAVTVDRYSCIPYIFSEKELKNIFAVCDNYPVSDVSSNRHLIVPLLFRMLYGCGLRISEALNLKLNEVDLKQGTLFMRYTALFKVDR